MGQNMNPPHAGLPIRRARGRAAAHPRGADRGDRPGQRPLRPGGVRPPRLRRRPLRRRPHHRRDFRQGKTIDYIVFIGLIKLDWSELMLVLTF